MPTETLIWAPTAKQQAFLECPCEDVLFGGSRGPGKTDGLLGDWMLHAADHGPHARGILFRRTYPELEEVERRCGELFPHLGAQWRAQSRTWTWPNGASLRLRYLERTAHASRYQGHSYTWVAFDELQQWPDFRGVDQLRATLRSAQGVPTYFRATANPGGAGHNLVKARYIDPSPPMTPFLAVETVGGTTISVERCYVPATLDDNPYLMRNDPGYWQRIVAAAGGNEALLRAWRYGDWDIVAGGMFDDVWRAAVHAIPPFPIPAGWYVDRAHDWGSSKPFCTLWFAESNGEQVRLADGTPRSFPPGTLIVIAEDYGWTGTPNEGIRATATQIAQRTKAAERAMGVRVRPGPADDPIFEVRNGQSMADDMAKVGIAWEQPTKGPGSRVAGWLKIRELLDNARQQPMEGPGLFIFETCRNLIRTLPALPRDERKPDDVDTTAEDHAADCLRLRVLARKRIARRGRLGA